MSVSATVIRSLSPSLARETLLDEFHATARQRIGSALWIGVSPEAVNEARARLSHSSGDLLAPHFFDWDGLARRILTTPSLAGAAGCVPKVRRRLLLQEIIAELHREKRLVYFGRSADSRGLLDSVAGFVAELAATNVAVEQFGESAAQRRVVPDGRQQRQSEAVSIAERYFLRLREQGWIDPGELLSRALDLLKTAGRTPFEKVETIFVDGSSEIDGVRLALLKVLSPSVSRVWISLPGEPGGSRAELFQSSQATSSRLQRAFANVDVLMLEDDSASAGLAHLRRTIFPENGLPARAEDAAGISLIEAPGSVGEARLVARRIHDLLGEGDGAGSERGRSLFDDAVRPERILVAARHLDRIRDLLTEVFDEYRLPFDVEGEAPLSRQPIVKALLRAVRLSDENWPFSGVTAILRQSFFRPAWPECVADPEMPRHAEAFLRMLGEPRGRENVLRAVDIWADSPPEGLEDERAEEPRRLKKIRLARQCRPFLKRFFQAWECFPPHGSPAHFLQALQAFAADAGFLSEGNREEDRLSWRQWEEELSRWADIKNNPAESLTRSAFFHLLGTITAGSSLPRTLQTEGKIRIRSAETASVLEADYLFLIGLEEKSFPDLAPPHSLLDDADRNDLRENGLPFASSEERLSREMLLFHRLVSLPRKELILSYAAVDEKGQPYLPSSFLRAIQDCFTEGAIPVERQRMLIEGYTKRRPISAAELRVQFASERANLAGASGSYQSKWKHPRLPADVMANLQDAAAMARSRFRSDEYDAFDGWLQRPPIVAELATNFGPTKIFSPTALEAYVACPFRFFLGRVLGLAPLETPVEEVEDSRRGSTFHRALARFHAKLLRENQPVPPAQATELLQREIAVAVEEYQLRAPSEAAKVLWSLEGKRLLRAAARYAGQWRKFIDGWTAKNAAPSPAHLEADFGLASDSERAALTIEVDGVEVRIGGRIDRVDATELPDGLGFWIIDYKTGDTTQYTGGDLIRFEKLQLSLYALAVEKVFFAGRKARPLGLAYWMVAGTGDKPVLPDARQRFSWLAAPENWQRFREQLEQWVARLVGHIREGHFPLAPRSEFCTDTCDFSHVCRIGQSRNTGKKWNLPLPLS